MEFALYLLQICLLAPALSHAQAKAQNPCDRLRAEVGSQTNFSPPRKNRLPAVGRGRGQAAEDASKQMAEDSEIYFVFDKTETSVTVFKGGDSLLKINVPKYSYRPLKARWINSKLLYLETWFDPHYGAYWIYDVERERVITHELIDDGHLAWWKCLQRNKQQ